MNLLSCPKCGTSFQTPLDPSAACPACGVFFFKVLAEPVTMGVPARAVRASPRRGSGVVVLAGLAVVAGIGLGYRFLDRGKEAARRPPPPVPAAVATDQVPAAPDTPAILTAPKVPAVVVDADPKAVDNPKSAEIERALEKLPPFVRKLVMAPDTMFDMQEETYRIANASKIHLEDVFFDGNEVRANVGDGSSFAAAAFAMTGLRGERRVCAIRVIRPSSDSSYSPGAKTSRWVTVNRRTTLAHELAHCVDWQSGSTERPANLPRPPDNISGPDQDRRWREEFADVHAMTLLKNAYGEDLAREAATVRAFVRLDAPIWYSHARVPLSSPDIWHSGSPDETRAIVGRYWGS